jgi:Wiskott-Aldrich syndrome protein
VSPPSLHATTTRRLPPPKHAQPSHPGTVPAAATPPRPSSSRPKNSNDASRSNARSCEPDPAPADPPCTPRGTRSGHPLRPSPPPDKTCQHPAPRPAHPLTTRTRPVRSSRRQAVRVFDPDASRCSIPPVTRSNYTSIARAPGAHGPPAATPAPVIRRGVRAERSKRRGVRPRMERGRPARRVKVAVTQGRRRPPPTTAARTRPRNPRNRRRRLAGTVRASPLRPESDTPLPCSPAPHRRDAAARPRPTSATPLRAPPDPPPRPARSAPPSSTRPHRVQRPAGRLLSTGQNSSKTRPPASYRPTPPTTPTPPPDTPHAPRTPGTYPHP